MGARLTPGAGRPGCRSMGTPGQGRMTNQSEISGRDSYEVRGGVMCG